MQALSTADAAYGGSPKIGIAMKPIVLAAALAWGAGAQTLMDPPALIRVIRTPGLDLSAAGRYADAGASTPVLGIASIVGSPETWLIETHSSFASVEQLDQALRKLAPEAGNPRGSLSTDEVLPPSGSWLALYRPGWSYRPDEAVRNLAKARYWHIALYRTKPEADGEVAELLRARKRTFDSANLDRPDMVYQVMSGAPSGTYLVIAPLVSLKSMDDSLATLSSYLRTEENDPKEATARAEVSHENLLFRVEPENSYVSDDFAAADPAFWRGLSK
jgi:hypothetical protein